MKDVKRQWFILGCVNWGGGRSVFPLERKMSSYVELSQSLSFFVIVEQEEKQKQECLEQGFCSFLKSLKANNWNFRP